MNIPKYPNDFYSFKDGVSISDEQINKWIEECINDLENNKQSQSVMRMSGNTSIQVNRIYITHDSDDYDYQVMVSKDYSTADVFR